MGISTFELLESESYLATECSEVLGDLVEDFFDRNLLSPELHSSAVKYVLDIYDRSKVLTQLKGRAEVVLDQEELYVGLIDNIAIITAPTGAIAALLEH